MNDFQVAFEEGIKAYKDANRAKAEIEGVIREFSDQVREASKGEVLEVKVVLPPRPEERPTLEELNLGRSPRTHAARLPRLVAFARTPDDRMESVPICEIRRSSEGYPVQLGYANRDVLCHDKESLELALVNLLKHPETGAKFASLIRAASES